MHSKQQEQKRTYWENSDAFIRADKIFSRHLSYRRILLSCLSENKRKGVPADWQKSYLCRVWQTPASSHQISSGKTDWRHINSGCDVSAASYHHPSHPSSSGRKKKRKSTNSSRYSKKSQISLWIARLLNKVTINSKVESIFTVSACCS